MLDEEFGCQFGLLEEEVLSLLQEHQVSCDLAEVRAWYNGYKVGSYHLYNPWSILQCIQKGGQLKPYWVNTSDNALIKELCLLGNDSFKQDLEDLVSGKSIRKPLEEGIVFPDLPLQENAIWNLLFFSGYLTLKTKPVYEDYGLQCQLKIPNQEIHSLYQSMIQSWMRQYLSGSNQQLLLKSLIRGDVETFAQVFHVLIFNSMSSYDLFEKEPERVYHAFVLGLLVSLDKTHEVKSNRESGFGRYDVCLIPKASSKLGIVLEFKKAGQGKTLEKACKEVLCQIEEKQYVQELRQRGIQKILLLGIAFSGKKVLVLHKTS